jgi:hypothetical protein
MEPDPTPVVQLAYSTQHDSIGRMIVQAFAYAALAYGAFEFIGHASMLVYWAFNGNFGKLLTATRAWRNALGIAIMFGHALAGMALIASAVGLIGGKTWSRKVALAAAWLSVLLALIDLGTALLGLRSSPGGIFEMLAIATIWTGPRMMAAVFPAMLIWFLNRGSLRELFDPVKN